MARGAVGPVQVLDYEHHRPVLTERLEQSQQALEDASLGDPLAPVAGAEAGQQRVEAGAMRGRKRVESRIPVAHQRTKSAKQRGVRQLALAQLHGVAPQDPRALLASPLHELVGEPRFAYARLTGDHRQRRAALRRVA